MPLTSSPLVGILTSFFNLRFAFVCRALLFLLMWTLADAYLPPWLKSPSLVFDWITRRMIPANTWLIDLRWTIWYRTTFLVAIASAFIFFAVASPIKSRIVLYFAFVDFLIPTVYSKVQYIRRDGPPDGSRNVWRLHRDGLVAYIAVAYAWTNRAWIWPSLWRFAAILFSVTVCFAALWSFALRHPHTVIGKVVHCVLRIMSRVALVYYYDLACFLYWLPRKVDQVLIQYQQRRRIDGEHNISHYEYLPLEPGEIRVLRLPRRSWLASGTLTGTLENVKLSDPSLEYEAASYRWGSSERYKEIVINEKVLAITESAFDLLFARRTVWRERVIWIDSICINQDDLSEKTKQITLMRDIYCRAQRVIVFLGAEYQSPAASLMLDAVAATPQLLKGRPAVRTLGSMAVGDPNTSRWRSLVSLLRNPYFSRLWVVQEVALAQDVQIFNGGHYIPWQKYVDVACSLNDSTSRDLLNVTQDKTRKILGSPVTTGTIIAISDCRNLCQDEDLGEAIIPLPSILLLTRTARATDARDKIYGILGLMQSHSSSSVIDVVANYDIRPEDLYKEILQKSILEYQAVDLLSLAGIGFSQHRLNIPSWVPDLSEVRYHSPLTLAFLRGDHHRAALHVEPMMMEGFTTNTISVQGALCDRIEAISSYGPMVFGDLQPGDEISAKDQLLCRLGFFRAAVDVAIDRNAFSEIFWHALIGDRLDYKITDDPRISAMGACCLRMMEDIAQSESNHPEPPPDWMPGIFSSFGLTYPADMNFMFQYMVANIEASYGRQFAVTGTGRLCLIPPLAQVGDQVFVPYGAQVPYLIRAKEDIDGADMHSLVGEAYVQSLMAGELKEMEEPATIVTLV